MASNGYYPYGRQYQGSTRNESPVYLMYPPDSCGRQPNEHARLQYANEAQREAYEQFQTTQRNQAAATHQGNQPAHSVGPPLYNNAGPRRTSGAPTTMMSSYEPTYITRVGDNTSSESSSGSNSRPRTERTLTRYWYCCNHGCPNNGPYIESIYSDCALGCGHVKCRRCRREIVSLRDRPPAEVPSRPSYRS